MMIAPSPTMMQTNQPMPIPPLMHMMPGSQMGQFSPLSSLALALRSVDCSVSTSYSTHFLSVMT